SMTDAASLRAALGVDTADDPAGPVQWYPDDLSEGPLEPDDPAVREQWWQMIDTIDRGESEECRRRTTTTLPSSTPQVPREPSSASSSSPSRPPQKAAIRPCFGRSQSLWNPARSSPMDHSSPTAFPGPTVLHGTHSEPRSDESETQSATACPTAHGCQA